MCIRDSLIMAHVKCFERVGATVQNRQRGIVAYIKRGELVGVAVQIRQRGVVPYIKRGELVVGARQMRQRGVLAHIERSKLVAHAPQLRQRGVVPHIKRGELVFGAVQYAYLPVNGYGLRTKKVFHLSLIHIFLLCYDNKISGDNMTALVNSLPDRDGKEEGVFWVIAKESDTCLLYTSGTTPR